MKKSCDQCVAVMIQGVFCHEHGCPDAKKEVAAPDSVLLCQTCKRGTGDDYTIGCPECFDDEHKRVTP